MHIYNLTPKDKALLDIVWSMDDLDKVTAFMNSLPFPDAAAIKHLIDVARLGGDDVTDVRQAKQIINKIRKL